MAGHHVRLPTLGAGRRAPDVHVVDHQDALDGRGSPRRCRQGGACPAGPGSSGQAMWTSSEYRVGLLCLVDVRAGRRSRSAGLVLLDLLQQAGELGNGQGEVAPARVLRVPYSDAWRKPSQLDAVVFHILEDALLIVSELVTNAARQTPNEEIRVQSAGTRTASSSPYGTATPSTRAPSHAPRSPSKTSTSPRTRSMTTGAGGCTSSGPCPSDAVPRVTRPEANGSGRECVRDGLNSTAAAGCRHGEGT